MAAIDAPSHLSSPGIATAARSHVLDGLTSDFRRVKQMCRQFEKLDPSRDAEAREALVSHVLDELTVHAALEQELLYPALRDAMGAGGGRTIDAAEDSLRELHALINPLRTLRPDDGTYAELFRALCQRALRHRVWEEDQLFPQLAQLDLDWARLEGEIDQRREELVVSESPVEPG